MSLIKRKFEVNPDSVGPADSVSPAGSPADSPDPGVSPSDNVRPADSLAQAVGDGSAVVDVVPKTPAGAVTDEDMAELAKDGQLPPKKPTLRPGGLKNDDSKPKNDLNSMTELELLQLRDEIDEKLPALALKDFNLEEELLLQYRKAKALQTLVMDDNGTPTNQKAQVANSISKLLADITRMRNEIYNGEQARLLEAAVAKSLSLMTKEAQAKFFEVYQRNAEELARGT